MNTPALPLHADIAIGGVRVRLHTDSQDFLAQVEARYAGYMDPHGRPDYQFDMHLQPPEDGSPDEDVRVFRRDGLWCIQRGDFRAEWDPMARSGWIRQTPNPYSLDSVLRIVHTLVLARDGGVLMHASSAVRDGRAWLFAGVSGAGKTTIARLAPPDVQLLTDEISYVRRGGDGYKAWGTPFYGDLGRAGENLVAPLAGIFLLAQGPENRIEPLGPGDAVRGLLANTLFFAQDRELVQAVFAIAGEIAARVPVRRLTFLPDQRVWDLIGNDHA